MSAGEATAEATTFTVHGHHYAVCELTGLPTDSALPYRVHLDQEQVWPEADSGYPPSLLRTLGADASARIAFGSCHTPTTHSAEHVRRYGRDMLRSYAEQLITERRAASGAIGSTDPSLLLLIGDQVYADELQPSMRTFLREHRGSRNSDTDPPEDEVVSFEEYAELYRQAWTDPDIRWLLSTVPTLMLFDDHDVRDDWNTSGTWRREIARTPWWKPRVTSGLGAYWIYQHLGNLSAEERAADPVFRDVVADDGDSGDRVDAFAWRAHAQPDSYRWSYGLDFGRNRLLMMDTRCGRLVDDDSRRSMLSTEDTAWLDAQVTGGVDHLIIASSLPFLMPPAIHHLEAWNEAVCAGAWGRLARGPGEKLRQDVDLEHWPAFQRSFRSTAGSVLRAASGDRGTPPASVLFLGGDVHFSYLAQARPAGADSVQSRIVQLVSSPTCNRLPGKLRWAMWGVTRRLTSMVGAALARSAGVRPSPLRWRLDAGPWFDNTLAFLELNGRTADVYWASPPALGSGRGSPHDWTANVRRHRVSEETAGTSTVPPSR
nr:alkaline phosphatase D family protein [Haloactinospora alba]